MAKRLKTGSKPNEYIPTDTDKDHFTELERSITTGRFLLEKRTKFQIQPNSRVVSCDYSTGSGNKVLVLG